MCGGGQTKKYYNGRLKGILKLLVNYWLILIGFTGLSMLIGNGNQMPGTLWQFIGNVTTFDTSYNGAWWYLFVYILLVLISSFIFRCSNRLPDCVTFAVSFIIYSSAYYVRFSISDKNWFLTKYGLIGMTFFEFIIGMLACKGMWIEKIKCYITKRMCIWKRVILSFGLLIGILIGHTLVIPSLFVAPFTGGIIIGVFSIWEKPEWIKNVFLFLGKPSTNIWLIHMFFYQYIFVNLVFVGQYPLIILTIMMCLAIICSMGINYVMKKMFKSI